MLRYFGKYAKRVSVMEPEESDFPDKRQHDGIGGDTSVAVDNSAPCNQAAVPGNAAASASTSWL